MKKIGGYILLGLGLTLSLGTGASWWYYKDALHFPDSSFAETRSLLVPYMEVFLPQGDGPFPTALLFHGCDGINDSSQPKAEAMVQQGFAAILVDSNTPRGVDWQMSCDGRVLLGTQRAADVLVALDYARQHPAMDAQQLFLVGYSHGGWTSLEALRYGESLPPGLGDSPGSHLAGVRGVVAWYPYCGIASEFRKGWDSNIPVLMLLAGEDEITAPEPCEDVARRQEATGHPVEHIVYPEVTHGFDLVADWVVHYDPETARRATDTQFSFLDRLRN